MSGQTTLRDQWGNLAVTISCKGIVFEDEKIWLRMNERGDWELPGGRLNEGEQPEDTVARELSEELGAQVVDISLVDAYVWRKDFGSSTHVEILTYRCRVMNRDGEFESIGEAGASTFKLVTLHEALNLPNLSDPYKRALRKL